MPTRFVFVVGAFALAMLLFVDRICISTAEGAIRNDLGLSKTEFGWALSAFALGYALCQTPTGMMSDRFGPRVVLSTVVAVWSVFTGLTGAVRGLSSLIAIRFLFGVGEAGAYPGIARAVYSWIPMHERGVVQGIVFSAGRLGAAFALPLVAWMVGLLGWRTTFVVLMFVGLVWALVWLLWFRNDPAEHPRMSAEERDYIVATRQQSGAAKSSSAGLCPKKVSGTLERSISKRLFRLLRVPDTFFGQRPSTGAPFAAMFGSANMWLLMFQYFCSNFTFFFCLSWMFPYLKDTYRLDAVTAGWYSSTPLVFGALGNLCAGWLIDRIYRAGQWTRSRQVPAAAGFALAAVGLLLGLRADSPGQAVAYLSLAVFGADMTISPSWAVCVDIGRDSAGRVSGTMNMAGNLGSFVTSLAFPYFLEWTGSPRTFFVVAAILNALAVAAWLLVRPERALGRDD